MTTQAPPSNLLPLNPEQLARLQAATTDFTPTQLAWVSGYFWGVLNQQSGAAVAAPAPAAEGTDDHADFRLANRQRPPRRRSAA
ncbi:sulfite reductase subunit alpha [Klebsiella pneumoniae]|uniref:Sulfite reductase subunit alpha n=1 Tax=Klebsiella pneumoniae TaxID=573 RepID=A0A378ABC9_KLEPN|nr:sulfite reductase subunit alpha [Klebsiella pneumoniae]